MNSILVLSRWRLIGLSLGLSILAFLMLSGGKASAASTSSYPETWASGHYLTISRNGNGIYLNAPYAYMKIKFDAATYYYDIEVYDGCWWRGAGSIDGGTTSPSTCQSGDVEFFFCPSNAAGAYDSSYKTNGRCYRTDPASWPSGRLGPQNHRFKQNGTAGTAWPLDMPIVNGERSIYLVAEMKVAGSNAFRIRSVARNSAGATVSGLDTKAGLGGQLTMPLSIGRMPLTAGGAETFRVRFQMPCSPPASSFRLGWFDADRPPSGIPYDADISWRLINTSVIPNQVLTSAQMAFISGMSENTFLGGNDQESANDTGPITVGNGGLLRVQAGDEYLFEWINVNANNGVQVKIPFDEADVGASCNPPTGGLTGTAASRCTAITGFADDADSPSTAVPISVYKNATRDPANPAAGRIALTSANNNFSVSTVSHRDFGTDVYRVYAEDVNRSGGPTGEYVLIGTATVGPCLQYTCGNATVTPTNPEPGQQFSMTVSFNVVLTGTATPASVGSNGTPQPWYIHLQITPGVFARAQIGSGTLSSSSSPNNSISATRNSLTAPAAGGYDASWWVRSSAAGADLNPPGTCGNPGPEVTVTTRPYTRFYGSDSLAGIGVGDVSNICTLPGVARFVGFNQGLAGAGGPGAGAGSQLALFSRGRNVDFVSAALRISPIPAPNPLKGLTFANTGAQDAQANGNYGGEWGGGYFASLCVPDPFAGVPAASIIPGGPGSGEVAGRTLGIGQKETIYIDGDAFITGDILYSNEAAFGNPSDIPAFRLVVRGNIYIHPDVQNISGQLIAQPRTDGTGGRVYTCGTTTWLSDSAPAIQYLPTLNQLVTACNKKLIIYGSVTAQTIKLLRTLGTLNAATASETYTSLNIAETIIFPPELWITSPQNTTSSSLEPYNSIYGLPPIL